MRALAETAELIAWATAQFGPVDLVAEHSWPHGESRVISIARPGGLVVIKSLRQQVHFERERDGCRYAEAILGEAAPALLASDSDRLFLAIRHLPGSLAQLHNDHDPDTHFRAAQLLRRLHDGVTVNATTKVERASTSIVVEPAALMVTELATRASPAASVGTESDTSSVASIGTELGNRLSPAGSIGNERGTSSAASIVTKLCNDLPPAGSIGNEPSTSPTASIGTELSNCLSPAGSTGNEPGTSPTASIGNELATSIGTGLAASIRDELGTSSATSTGTERGTSSATAVGTLSPSASIDVDLGARIRASFERYAARCHDLVTTDELVAVRRLIECIEGTPIPVVACHGDFSPRNWLVDHDGTVRIIDFGRFQRDHWTMDVLLLSQRYWKTFPGLRDAFLAGYGRALDDADQIYLRAARGRWAIGTILWAREHDDPPFEQLGRDALADLLEH